MNETCADLFAQVLTKHYIAMGFKSPTPEQLADLMRGEDITMRGDHTMHPSTEHAGYKFWYNYEGLYGYHFRDIQHVLMFFYGNDKEHQEARDMCLRDYCEPSEGDREEQWHVEYIPNGYPFKVLASYSEENEDFYSDHNVLPESAVQEFTFYTQAEASAFIDGVNETSGYLEHVFVQPKDILKEFQAFDGFINTYDGLTYQWGKDDMPDMEQEPVHLNDIEISDWWLSLTQADWELICEYADGLKGYNSKIISMLYDDKQEQGIPFGIEQIVSKQDGIPDNCMIYMLGNGHTEPYQDNEEFISNIVNKDTTILYEVN